LSKKPIVNTQDKLGMSALSYAIKNGDFDLVSILLKAGADVTLKANDGKSALMLADEAVEIEKQNEIKVKTISEDSVLVTEGFIYQKGIRSSNPPKLLVSEANEGVLKATGTFTVGGGGSIGLSASGGTFVKLEGEPSHSSLGAKWVFEHPNISFRNGGYVYISKHKDAVIEFRDDGVLLNGFTMSHEKLKSRQKIVDLLKTSSKK